MQRTGRFAGAGGVGSAARRAGTAGVGPPASVAGMVRLPLLAGARAPAARHDLPLLLGGTAVSTIGASLTLLAVTIHLRPAGAGWIAAVMAAELVPFVLLAPAVGHLVDRVRNRELLIVAILLQAAGVLVAAFGGLADGRQLVLVGALALVGVGSAVVSPTVASLLPRVTGEDGATRAYGWYSAIQQAGFLVGFALAGVLVEATSVRTALLVDAVTYVVMAVAVTALRTQRVPQAHEAEIGLWVGFDRLRRDRLLLVTVLGLGAAVLATVIVNVAEVFFVLEDIGAGPAAYGLVTALWPAAGVVAGWYAGRLGHERAQFVALVWACVVMGAALALAGAVVSLVAVGIGWLIGGAAGSVQRVALTALVRERTPDAERGRVFAAIHAVVQAGNLAGLAVGAAVVGLIGARSSLLLSGALTALAGAAMWWIGRSALRR